MDNKFYNCITFLCICVYDCVCGYTCMYLCLVWKLKVYLGVASIQLSRCILICASVGCVRVWMCMTWCWESCWIALHHIYWGAWAQSSLTQLIWPLDQQDFRWDTTSTQGYMGAGDLNLLLTLNVSRTVLAEPFSQPYSLPAFWDGVFLWAWYWL